MNKQFVEHTKSEARRVRKLGVGLLATAAFGLLLLATLANASTLGPLIELSRPNAAGRCDTGFPAPPGNWTLNDAFEPFVAVNPVNPKTIVAVWIQGLLQNIIAA